MLDLLFNTEEAITKPLSVSIPTLKQQTAVILESWVRVETPPPPTHTVLPIVAVYVPRTSTHIARTREWERLDCSWSMHGWYRSKSMVFTILSVNNSYSVDNFYKSKEKNQHGEIPTCIESQFLLPSHLFNTLSYHRSHRFGNSYLWPIEYLLEG